MSAKANPCLDELNKQRKSKDKCDVTIQIDDETFPCHRGILSSWSSYFKAMFDGNYKESESNIITIKEIDPTTFEEILDAMYTGKITITAANACRLLKACSFLALNEFEKSCVKFVEENVFVDHLVELCLYADILKEDKLFNEMTKCIAEKFATLSQTYDFSTLSSSIFQAILSQPTLDRRGDIVFLEITKWVKKNSIDDPYSAFEKFLQAAKLTTVSPLVLGKLLLSTEDVEIKEAISKLNETKETLRIAEVVKPTLKVYLKASVEKITGQPNVVSLAYAPENEDQNWILADVFNSPLDNLKTVCIGKQQYFLGYERNECAKDSCQFWMVEDRKITALRKPPAIAERFELVELKGTIFLYFIDVKARIIDKKNSESTEENINMLYFYYPERDEWFSSPEMKHTVKGAAFVGLGYNLCLFGGLQGPKFDKFYQKAQWWDARCSVWDENHCSMIYDTDSPFPNDETLEFFYGAACVDGSSVCISGSYHGNQFWTQCYSSCNLTSDFSQWRKFGNDMIRERGNYNTLTLFNDEIYAIDNSLSLPFSSVEKFVKDHDSYLNGDEVSPLPKKVVSSKGIFYTGDVTATVVSSY